MKYRSLFTGGEQVSVLGFGAWPIGGGMGHVDEQVAIATVRMAIDNGISVIDTAQAYRESERILGKALRNGYRERCFLATKVSKKVAGDYSQQSIAAALEESLRLLNTDVVDLYQIHNWPTNVPIEESIAMMLKLREQGKVRYIGVSNFTTEQMKVAQQCGPIHTNQLAYNLFNRNAELNELPYAIREGIGILAHSALAKGLLTGKYASGHVFGTSDERINMPQFQGDEFSLHLRAVDQLKAIAHDKGITLVQMAIAWILRTTAVRCVLVGAKSPAQIQGQLGAEHIQFTAGELDRIDAILAILGQ